MVGIVVGLTALTLFAGVGLMALFESFPVLRTILEVFCVGYLLWLAWKVATAAPLKKTVASSQPMTFLQAAAFQWVNPKAWAMGLSAITIYAPDRSLPSVMLVASAFVIVCFPAISAWAWLGTVVRHWLSSKRRWQIFNITMATLLVGSLFPVLASL